MCEAFTACLDSGNGVANHRGAAFFFFHEEEPRFELSPESSQVQYFENTAVHIALRCVTGLGVE